MEGFWKNKNFEWNDERCGFQSFSMLEWVGKGSLYRHLFNNFCYFSQENKYLLIRKKLTAKFTIVILNSPPFITVKTKW